MWYATKINIEATFDLELKPGGAQPRTADNNDEEEEESDKRHNIQYFTRTVKKVIPFDIHFDLDLSLWSQVDVDSPFLRKATALLEASVLEVNPTRTPWRGASSSLCRLSRVRSICKLR